MNLSVLDKIQEAERIANGVRDLMLIFEDPAVKVIPNSVFTIVENAMDKMIELLEEVNS